MPKDAKKNVDRYKVAGGHLNEFEFHRNQAEVAAEQKSKPPQATKGTKAANPNSTKGASAKKLAARKAAKK